MGKRERLLVWSALCLLLIMMFVPWGRFGVEPLVFGVMPRWLFALSIPCMVYIILFWVFLGRRVSW